MDRRYRFTDENCYWAWMFASDHPDAIHLCGQAPTRPFIATVVTQNVDESEWKANARLIASAPRLLRLVEDLSKRLEQHSALDGDLRKRVIKILDTIEGRVSH